MQIDQMLRIASFLDHRRATLRHSRHRPHTSSCPHSTDGSAASKAKTHRNCVQFESNADVWDASRQGKEIDPDLAADWSSDDDSSSGSDESSQGGADSVCGGNTGAEWGPGGGWGGQLAGMLPADEVCSQRMKAGPHASNTKVCFLLSSSHASVSQEEPTCKNPWNCSDLQNTV